ncbi:MAG: hypothetical protein M3P96_01975 [Actinomycetota bacterium]|nr:hypothetical protein [Actinomycetota bacterium]
MSGGGPPPQLPRGPGQPPNATLGSAAGRHAIRLGLLLPATELLGRALPLAQEYWVP